jgi:hypothetical protein
MDTEAQRTDVEAELAAFKDSLLANLGIGGLFTRNPIAHKWKAPFRAVMLRECVFWRLHELLEQSYVLYQQQHMLGARILLRSAFETLAVLIRINQHMGEVVSGEMTFHEFDERTCKMLLGSKDKSTNYEAVNVNTVIRHCAKRYDWIEKLYADLSESAHPNHDGLCIGYSKIDREALEAQFASKWNAIYSAGHLHGLLMCIEMFRHEYNDEWSPRFEALEKWMEANDAELEATKPGAGLLAAD